MLNFLCRKSIEKKFPRNFPVRYFRKLQQIRVEISKKLQNVFNYKPGKMAEGKHPYLNLKRAENTTESRKRPTRTSTTSIGSLESALIIFNCCRLIAIPPKKKKPQRLGSPLANIEFINCSNFAALAVSHVADTLLSEDDPEEKKLRCQNRMMQIK